MKDSFFIHYILLLLIILFSCENNYGDKVDTDTIYICDTTLIKDILIWKITGPISPHQDTLLLESGIKRPQGITFTSNPDTAIKIWQNNLYIPEYGQLDLKEVYNISVEDTTKILDSLITYLLCTIKSEHDKNMFLHVKSKMQCSQYINGDSLKKKEYNDFDIYPIRLHAGINTLVVKTQGKGVGYWYEATLLDSTAFSNLYLEMHTGYIIHPIVKSDSIVLTEAHWTATEKPVKLLFHDTYGNQVATTIISDNTITYHINGLQENHAYICSMIIDKDTVKQPIMTAAPEDALEYYKNLRDSLPLNHPRINEINQLLYRINKLFTLSDKMKADRWFPFKLPWVVYQLEHVFTHLDGTYGNDEAEYNFKFITYNSDLDGGLQRYILVTPNRIDKRKKYPLVVIVRPNNEKHYHLFFSPQIAHQWVVNNMQMVANKYNCFVLIPEARMMLNETLTPFAESEMKYALADVQEHYNIDSSRIFLHANCSGGYRALQLATRNPEMFAAMALYAPIYKDNKNSKDDDDTDIVLKNLKNMPVLIYGDPADIHSPINNYIDLIKKFEKGNIPFKLILRRNSGQGWQGYHRMVIGQEACQFFKDKKKSGKHVSKNVTVKSNISIGNFYSHPFIYVYNAGDTTLSYKNLICDIRNEYETYFYSNLPLIPDTRVTKKILETHNVFLIGKNFTCSHVRDLEKAIENNRVNQSQNAKGVFLYENPALKDKLLLLYIPNDINRGENVMQKIWELKYKSVCY